MKLSLKKAREMGVPVGGQKRPQAASATKGDTEGQRKAFVALCEAHGLPEPVPEYRFARSIGREWRFDWCWAATKVVLEVQGGLFTGGRHVRGAALMDEMEKLNTAALFGFAVLFATPKQVASGEILPIVKQAIERRR